MEILLSRLYKKDTYTIGKLFVDGVPFSDTLEDTVRDYSDPEFKIYGKTAIPYGEYRVTLEHSPKFSPRYGDRKVPYLHNVPNFTGILIHSGNTAEDTDGCILVGLNTKRGMITQSKDTFLKLLDILEKVPSGESITIKVVG